MVGKVHNWRSLQRRMYKVKYYLTGGTLVSKVFATLHEATMFAVYKAPFQSVHEIYKVEEK